MPYHSINTVPNGTQPIFRMKYSKSLLLVALAATSISACKKNEEKSKDPITLDCGYFDSGTARTLTNYENKEVDYIVECSESVTSNLTIEAGTVIEFTSGAGLYVYEGAALRISGTSADPVVLTGTSKNPGAWQGLYIESTNPSNSITHAEISYAGGGTWSSNGETGALVIDGRVSVANTELSHSETNGIMLPYWDATPSFASTTIRNCETPVKSQVDYVSEFDGLSFSGNTNAYLYIYAQWLYGTTGQTLTFHDVDLPYRIQSGYIDNEDRTIVIEPGVTMEFESGSGIEVTGSAVLKAVGTASKPITFTGVSKQPAAWGGIYYDQTTSPQNEIAHATLSYAGGDDYGGAVHMWADPMLSIHNTHFSNSATCGIYDASRSQTDGQNPNLSLSNNTYTSIENENSAPVEPACCSGGYCYGY